MDSTVDIPRQRAQVATDARLARHLVRTRSHHRRHDHQGWDVQLTAYAGRRANFFPVGIAHSIVGGSAWEPTPSRAVQRAAWEVLTKEERR
jgi:hypothetical protein